MVEFQPSLQSLEDAEWLTARLGPVCMRHRSCLLDHILPYAHRRLQEYEAALRYELFDEAVANRAMHDIGQAMVCLANADGAMRRSAYVAGEA